VTERSGGMADAADAEPRIEVGLATDVGRMRTGNEDSIICEPLESSLVAARGLFCAVADGMGGHAAGEDASSLAVKVARDVFYAGDGRGDPLEALRFAVAEANAAVYEAGAGTTGRDHMGSTLTAAVLLNGRVFVGHVGDSRCYIVQEDDIYQISRDHSWVAEEVAAGRMTPEQARISPRRNIITRALGLRPDVDVDAYEAELEPGCAVVICSDGLHGLVTDDEITAYVRRLRPPDAVDALVQLANERGGPDNISVVVARVLGDGADEADTQRGMRILTEASMPTEPMARAEPETHPAPMPTQSPAPPVIPPAPAMPQPTPPVPGAEPGAAAGAAVPSAGDGAGRMLARRQPASGRKGGVALIVVIVVLVVLGCGLGYVLFTMAGLGG
jgi:serine/threonine protein phosphatase PrpC